MKDDGTTPDDKSAYVDDVPAADGHMLRNYADGSWAIWHPADCSTNPASLLSDPHARAPWSDVVAAETRTS